MSRHIRCSDKECASRTDDTETPWFTVRGLAVDAELDAMETIDKLPTDAFVCGHCNAEAEEVLS